MLSEENIKSLSDDDLRKLLVSNQITCGPIGPTTRSVYEKKMIKHLKETNSFTLTDKRSVIPGRISPVMEIKMDLNNNETNSPVKTSNTICQTVQTEHDVTVMSDDELMRVLKQNNIKCGPVNQNTRSVYVKKLLKHLSNTSQEPILIVDDDDNAQVPAFTKEKEPTKTIQFEPEIQILNDDTITPKKSNTATLVKSEKSTKKIYPDLEFKLLTPTNNLTSRYEEADYQPYRNASASYSTNDMDRSFGARIDYSRPSNYELHNRNVRNFENETNYIAAANLRDRNRPLINLSSLFDKRPESHYYEEPNIQGPFEMNSVRNHIYSEPAPPQPVHLGSISKENSILKSIIDYKYYILLALAICFIILYLLISPENSAFPIDMN